MCRVYVLSSGHSQFQENCVDPLYQLHSLVDILQDGTDLQTYPENFTENYVIAYGTTGSVSNIDAAKIYDFHTAYEIEPTKMKMNVP